MLTVLTGRSRRLWPRVLEEVGQAHGSGAKRLLVITPDQYTLQAELDLINQLHLPGLLNIIVLSPSRLLTQIFALAGSPQRVRVDGRGKAMVLLDVLQGARKELMFYGGAVGRRGFTNRLGTSIGDFKRAGITPDAVEAFAQSLEAEDSLRQKLTDLALIYRRYEERLAGAFLDGEGVQDAMLARMPDSGFFDGAMVWIYGFDLISPQFLRQIALMVRLCDSVRLALTLENASQRDGLAFAPARETLARLARFFDSESLPWQRVHVVAPLKTVPEIQHLEQELFAIPSKPFPEEPHCVSLWAAANPYDEAMRTASAIRTFARAGVPFGDIVVVLGDLESYAEAISAAFGRSGVPYHLSRKRPALSHPLLRSWLAALRCVTKGWRTEDAMDWLKGGFAGLSREGVERLENYAVENGLRGAKWHKAVSDLEIEGFRAAFVAPLENLQKRLRNAADATESLAAAFGLLEDVNAYGSLDEWQKTLQARGLLMEAADCAQAWRIMLETLDQLHALLNGRRLPMGDLARVIEAGLGEAELGAIPATPGTVQLGKLGHLKIGEGCRILFLLGLQDGVLRASEDSLLTDEEVERAQTGASMDAAFGLRGDALQQLIQINLLDTMAAASERLFVSHSFAGMNGEAQRPATVIKLLRRSFPLLVERGGLVGKTASWHSAGTALDALGPALWAAAAQGELPADVAEVSAWLLNAPDTRLQAERVLRAFESRQIVEPLPKRTADALFSRSSASISRLETFASCPYRHFIEHGLKPIPRRPFVIARDETGSFYHRAMEGFAGLSKLEAHWPSLTRADSDALMDKVLEPLKAEWENQPLGDGPMERATGEAFCRIARRAAWNYTSQSQRGKFRLKMLEARFGPGEQIPPIALFLPDGRRIWLGGRIDRIDFYEEGEDCWLRVVDYKSGAITLEPSRIQAGLQLQLLLYLSAALTAFPGIQAAGAFYSRFDDPLIDMDSRDVSAIEKKIASELNLKGVFISELRVIDALEHGNELLNNDKTISKRAGAISAEDLSALMRYARALAEGIAGEIAQGIITPQPAQLDSWVACSWCDYKEICGFDPTLPGYRTRTLRKISKEELTATVRATSSEIVVSHEE